MQIYQVGGAVRDKLLGLPVQDHDWVVVGATSDEMLKLGYRQVGKDFPVFLHPDTHEEYALARTERKIKPGYTGFEINSAADVSLENDLARRDLTINAIAIDKNGNIIDPYHGQDDLQNKTLRHISPAFSEDPVRILRVARFLARFAPLGFSIAPETMTLMQQMVNSGEVDALVAERVWQETHQALTEPQPRLYFDALRQCGALARIFPEINALFGVPQPEQHHPEIDTGLHSLMVLEQAALLSTEPRVRWAALLHDLGKATTPKEEWPRHVGHEARTLPLIEQLCQRLRVPNDYRELALLAAQYHSHCHRAKELRPATLLDTLEAVDAFRRPARFEEFLLTCWADSRGRAGFEKKDYPQAEIFRCALRTALSIDAKSLVKEGFKGQKMADKLYQLRCQAIAKINA